MIRRIYNVLSLLLISAGAAVAQDATTTTAPAEIKNKKGESYLPVADEWALGVSANPFLDYIGNFVNGYDGFNSAPGFDFASNPANNIAIFGKKMIDANTAYRVRFNITAKTIIHKAVVTQDRVNANPDFPAFAEDWQNINTTSIVIAPGYEKRRGSTRLQGIYGGELVIGLNSNKVEYQYGNAQTADFTAPTSTDFVGFGFGNNLPNGNGTVRVVDDKQGMNFLVGARGFIGVEYFFIPKMSIGGEFGYMIAWQTQRRALTTVETFDNATLSVRQTKIDSFKNGGTTTLGLGLDNLSGSINLLFYF
jgi:hypothetical protein